MKIQAKWAGVALLMLLVGACATQQESYLKDNVNQVSQDAVAKRFGPPHHQQELGTGEAVWGYQFNKESDCTQYVLTFSRDKILRDWKKQEC
jgi:hypothetical protein